MATTTDPTFELTKEILAKIKDPSTGFPRNAHKKAMKSFKNCFTGTEVVSWCQKHLSDICKNRADALAFGKHLVREEIIHPLNASSSSSSKSENKEESSSSPSSSSSSRRSLQFEDSSSRFYAFTQHVVILGGGFAGSQIAKSLDGDYKVTLVDNKPYFECNISFATLVSDPSYIDQIRSDHNNYLKHTRVIVGQVTELSKDEISIQLLSTNESHHYSGADASLSVQSLQQQQQSAQKRLASRLLDRKAQSMLPTGGRLEDDGDVSSESSTDRTLEDDDDDDVTDDGADSPAGLGEVPDYMRDSSNSLLSNSNSNSNSNSSVSPLPSPNNSMYFGSASGGGGGAGTCTELEDYDSDDDDDELLRTERSNGSNGSGANGSGSKIMKLFGFDFVVVATGSQYNMKLFDRFIDAGKSTTLTSFRDFPIINCASSASILWHQDRIASAENLTVIGGGPVGIEVAGELLHKYPNKKINMVAKLELLDRFCAAAHKNVYRYFSSFSNMSMYFHEEIQSVSKDGDQFYVETNKGRRIKSDVIFSCIGFTPNTKFMRQKMAHTLNEGGFIKVNNYLQILGYPHMFAAGDILHIKEEKLAQTAKLHAEVVTHNIKKMASSGLSFTNTTNFGNFKMDDLISYSPANRIMIISLGPKKAVMVHGEKVIIESSMVSKVKNLVEYSTMKKVKGNSKSSHHKVSSPASHRHALRVSPPTMPVSPGLQPITPTSPYSPGAGWMTPRNTFDSANNNDTETSPASLIAELEKLKQQVSRYMEETTKKQQQILSQHQIIVQQHQVIDILQRSVDALWASFPQEQQLKHHHHQQQLQEAKEMMNIASDSPSAAALQHV